MDTRALIRSWLPRYQHEMNRLYRLTHPDVPREVSGLPYESIDALTRGHLSDMDARALLELAHISDGEFAAYVYSALDDRASDGVGAVERVCRSYGDGEAPRGCAEIVVEPDLQHPCDRVPKAEPATP